MRQSAKQLPLFSLGCRSTLDTEHPTRHGSVRSLRFVSGTLCAAQSLQSWFPLAVAASGTGTAGFGSCAWLSPWHESSCGLKQAPQTPPQLDQRLSETALKGFGLMCPVLEDRVLQHIAFGPALASFGRLSRFAHESGVAPGAEMQVSRHHTWLAPYLHDVHSVHDVHWVV